MFVSARGNVDLVLSAIDRQLLDRCLEGSPGSWEDFVDRYMGLLIHVVNHTAQSRSVRLSQEDRDDLCADALLAIIRDDFAVLRNFRGQSSLATYLTIVARRVVVRKMMRSKRPSSLTEEGPEDSTIREVEQMLEDREEVERLLGSLKPDEAQVLRLYHIEGNTYEEISDIVGISTNSVGPLLSRAREKLRRSNAPPAAS